MKRRLQIAYTLEITLNIPDEFDQSTALNELLIEGGTMLRAGLRFLGKDADRVRYRAISIDDVKPELDVSEWIRR